MKTLGTIFVLGIALVLAACGSNSNSNIINGNWTAALLNSSSGGSPIFNFTTTLTQSSGSSVSVTNLNFTTSSPCFASGSTATGGFTLSGNLNGVTSGGFQMNIQSTGSSTNLLTLQGTVSNNTISGTWSLSGTTSGCSGSGQFTMNKS
jgi:outer membrane lipopolysaccharide assembly protein LptE/RlpB